MYCCCLLYSDIVALNAAKDIEVSFCLCCSLYKKFRDKPVVSPNSQIKSQKGSQVYVKSLF